MTHQEIIAMARECHMEEMNETLFYAGIDDLERFAALVEQKEREACAKLVERAVPFCRISDTAKAVRNQLGWV